jgi:hypothetical protein
VKFSEGMAALAEWLRSQQAEDRAAEMVQQLDTFGLTA